MKLTDRQGEAYSAYLQGKVNLKETAQKVRRSQTQIYVDLARYFKGLVESGKVNIKKLM
jgi:hypothetical protein